MVPTEELAGSFGWRDKGEINLTSHYSFVVPDRPLGLTMAQFQPLPRQPDPFWKSLLNKKCFRR